jgi:hypothetical protein
MANKFDGDIRPLSNDQRYMGVVFTGSMKNAIKQAKAAPDHGLAPRNPAAAHGISRNRAALLEHLNLLSKPAIGHDVYMHGVQGPTIRRGSDVPAGFYTVDYAIKHGFIKPVTQANTWSRA